MAAERVRLVVFAAADPPGLAAAVAFLRAEGVADLLVRADNGPDPWFVFRAMEAANVYPPTAVAVVADSPAAVTGGLHAGAWAVGLVEGKHAAAELAGLPDAEREAKREAAREAFLAAGADAVIDTFADLPDLLTALNQQIG